MAAVAVSPTGGTAGRLSPRRGGFRRYLVAAVLVRLADEGARVALVLLALQRTQSAAIGGLLVASLLIPHVVAAPIVGLLTDRVRQPRRILATAAAGFAASLAVTSACLGRLPVWVTVVVLLAGGCCGPALTGGLSSQLSDLVSEAALPRAFGADSLSYNMAGIAGPAVAAALAHAWDPAGAIVALAASAAFGAVLLASLPLPRRASPSQHGLRLTDGVTAILRDRILRTITAASSLGQLGLGALPVVAAVLASRQQEPAATGWLMTAVAVGGLLGSLLWTRWPLAPSRAPSVVMLSLIGTGATLAAAAAVSSLWPTAILFGVSGVFIGPGVGALFTARQLRAPEQLQAQVFTIGAGLKTTTAAAGAAVGGAVAHLSTATQLLLVAGLPVLAGVLGALSLGKPSVAFLLATGRRSRSPRQTPASRRRSP